MNLCRDLIVGNGFPARDVQVVLPEAGDVLKDAEELAQYGSWSWAVGQNKVVWSDQLHRIFGLDPRGFEGTFEAYLQLVHADDRATVKAEIERAFADHQPFEFTERIVRPDGLIRVLQSRGKVYLDAAGQPAQLVGVCLDMTERVRNIAFRKIQQELTDTLAEPPALETALSRILSIVGFHLNLDFGQVWLANDAENFIEPIAGWHVPNSAYRGFLSTHQGVRLVKGAGIVGRVWQRAEPIWAPDIVTDDRALLGARAEILGLHAIMVFPMTAKGLTVGVLEFLSHEIRQPEPEVIEMLGVIGRQVGEFILRMRAEERLQETEDRFQLMIDNVRDYAIFFLDAHGTVASWNTSAEHLSGYKAHEIVGQHYSRFHPQTDIEKGKPQIALEVAAAQGRFADEGWRVRRDGSQFWASSTITALRDGGGNLKGFAKITRDISNHKWTEEELRSRAERLQSLSRRLAEVQENERRGLAQELHDRVGQNLTALSMNFHLLRGELSPDQREKVENRLDDCMTQLDEIVESTRNVMANLRPAVLDQFGLMAALRSMAESFQARTGVETSVSGEDPQPRMVPLIENAMYRIAQEALNNLAKHADAKHATLTLEIQRDTLRFTIADDGVGFDPSAPGKIGYEGGWGLITMRERAQVIGGELRVESAPGQGTKIVVETRL